MSQARPDQDPLAAFSAPVRAWFEKTLGSPTPPQSQGWSAIQRGEHTLILAPTGSGKTLAAFLWGIDRLLRPATPPQEGNWETGRLGNWDVAERGDRHPITQSPNHPITQPPSHPITPSPTRGKKSPGVRILYISPLKALNNDVERNLQIPLQGIRETAEAMGVALPEIRVAVRSGDTPQGERQKMVRRPPDILITTPESLYLLLTSPTARGMFRGIHTVIVDEIHTLVGTKRGVHLTLTLERLSRVAAGPVQRIGLSATIRPLDEAARFLGGAETRDQRPETGDQRLETRDQRPEARGQRLETRDPRLETRDGMPGPAEDEAAHEGLHPASCIPHPASCPPASRPVTVVDAHYRKELDLKVLSPIADFRRLPGGSVWPSLIPSIADLVRGHQSTLIFCNSRRMAERTADRLNEEGATREQRGQALALIEDGVATGIGMFASGDGTAPNAIRAHHGSISREARLEMERALKAGALPALVATASLELGIDIGAVDLVIQVQAPEGVARGLQRVGRAGHFVGQTSKARIFPTHSEDLIAAAAVAGGMLQGEVETTTTPRNPLDVLAQQLVAMVSVESWDVDDLFALVRRAYPYQELPRQVFDNVLEMLSGRYPTQAHRELRARISWDRVNNVLAALPGSQSLALSNGGTIPDRGTFSTTLSDGQTKLGELDEEFVYETRIGDTFMLGSQVWRVTEITDDRVRVVPAPGVVPRMPFWKGDAPWRPYELGRRVGAFRRDVAERVRGLDGEWVRSPEAPGAWDEPGAAAVLEWLRDGYALDENSARHVVSYVSRQLRAAGSISSDRAVMVESFRDAMGDPRVVIHAPFGGRVNGPWSLALREAVRERLGVEPEVQSNDDGILLRFEEADVEFPVDLVERMAPAEARERILRELPNSAVFGAQFRQNAARALLLPGGRPGKRTPFWLQRVRARELLHVVRRFPDFPMLIETYRDCLQDVMDLPHLEEVLREIQEGQIRVVTYEATTPSPVAQSLMAQALAISMYEGEAPKAETQLQRLAVDRSLLGEVLRDVALDEFLKPDAIEAMARQRQHTAPGFQARSAEELAIVLEELGDLSTAEIEGRCASEPAAWIDALASAGRILSLSIPTASGPEARWVHSLYHREYASAFGLQGSGVTAPGACRDRSVGSVVAPGCDDAATTPPPHDPTTSPQEAACAAILSRYLANSGPVTAEAIRSRYDFPQEWLAGALERMVAGGSLAEGRFTRATQTGDQYVERSNLEEIHRRTLSILRREVRPVPREVYADFLARWQHAHPAARMQGDEGLRRVLQQLRGIPLTGVSWERDILPIRVASFAPPLLDRLCESGEICWVASGEGDSRRARVAFVSRGEGRICLPPPPESLDVLSPDARAVYDFLKSEGSAFAADVQGFLRLSAEAAERALEELALSGLATSDSLAPLRRILAPPDRRTAPASAERRWHSSLETQLPGRVPDAGGWRSRRPSRGDYLAAKRRVSDRLQQADRPESPGRWGLVHRLTLLGRVLTPEEQAAAQARVLLRRWGVLSRAMLDAEDGPWEWDAVTDYLRLMEMRGEVRRGLFVEGLPGVQYALPEAVEALRECRDAGPMPDGIVVLNACDPGMAHGAGWATSDEGTIARLPSTWVAHRRGHLLLVAESGGEAITAAAGAPEEDLRAAADAVAAHLLLSEHRVTVRLWNGQPALDGPGAAILEGAGFYRDYRAMVRERSLW